MKAEVIAIGDEILLGQTQDTNSSYLAMALGELGVEMRRFRAVADEKEEILQAVSDLRPGTELVFITGGLGPTKDDLTKDTLSEFFGGELVFSQEVHDQIAENFKAQKRELNERNKSQAWIPSTCEPLLNRHGTAPGMRFERDGVWYISLPGVPYELRGITQDHIIPWIGEKWSEEKIYHRTLLTHGIPESELAGKLEGWEEKLPGYISLAYLPSLSTVKLRLTTRDRNENQRMYLDQLVEELRQKIGLAVYGEEEDTLDGVLGDLLKRSGMTVALAESCTGGYLAHLLTRRPGSSDYFAGSAVAYQDEVKQSILGVRTESLSKHGAVSKEVVLEMAKGVRERMSADMGIATSGIAGPSGGSEEKPVGTVWIGGSDSQGEWAHCFHFDHDRMRNIEKAALMALDMARKRMLTELA